MGTPLRVLLIEDSLADAELALAELRLGGYDPDYERVDTPEEMKAALEKKEWDIVLSDYVMPRFSGPAALKLLQTTGLDVPFIMVTGQVGEVTAVEVMKAGAQDYILKGNLTRLVPAIQRELRDTELRRERKQVEETLRRNLDRYQRLADTASWLLSSDRPQEMVEELCRHVMEYLDCHAFFNFLVDEQAGRLKLNACAGIPAEEAAKIRWLDFGVAVCGHVAATGRRYVAEHIPSAGDPLTTLVASFGILAYGCHPLLGRDGKVIGTLSFGSRSRETFSDDDLALMKKVTDYVAIAMLRVRAEEALRESEQRFSLIFEKSAFPAALSRLPDGTLVDVNEAFVNTFGYSKQEVVGKTTLDLGIVPDAEARARILADLKERGSVRDVEVTLRTKSGDRRTLSVNIDLVEMGGQKFILNATQDITALKQAQAEHERLLAEFQGIFVCIADGVVIQGPDGRIVRMNPAAERMLGYSPEHKNLPIEERPKLLRARKPDGSPLSLEENPTIRALHGETVQGMPLIVHTPYGSTVRIVVSAAPLRTADGTVLGAITTFTEITDKHAF